MTDLFDQVIELLAETERVSVGEVREASSHFTNAPTGVFLGGVSLGGQKIHTLSLRKHREVENIVRRHEGSPPDFSTQALVQQLVLEAEMLEAMFKFELSSRFSTMLTSHSFEIAVGFQIWAFSSEDQQEEPGEEQEEGDEITIPPPFRRT